MLHQYRWRHAVSEAAPWLGVIFDRGPFPAGGDLHALNVSGFHWGEDFDAELIPAMRLVVDFGLPDPAFLIGHGGQSGDPASPHYDDMIAAWIKAENWPLPFLPGKVSRQYRHRFTLEPASAP
jgi:acyl-homoserine-lactone acylase